MTEEQKKTNGAVTTKAASNVLSPETLQHLENLGGAGLETITTDDMATPRIKILASNSPELDSLENARPGMIMNSIPPHQMWKGNEGFDVIVCGYDKVWLEWEDRGIGSSAPVNIFSAHNKPTDAVRGDDGKFRLPSGNYLEESANFYVLILNKDGLPEPAIISMKSTQLKVARAWAYGLKNEFIQNPTSKKMFLAPSWYRIYHLTTTKQTNSKGSWFGWVLDKKEFITDDNTFEMASDFNESIRKGLIKPKYDEESDQMSGDIPF